MLLHIRYVYYVTHTLGHYATCLEECMYDIYSLSMYNHVTSLLRCLRYNRNVPPRYRHSWAALHTYWVVLVSAQYMLNEYMYVRMCFCMYACMHVCMYACMHVCMHLCVCVCVCMYVCMYVCMRVSMICLNVCVCMPVRVYVWSVWSVCMCVWMYVCMYVCMICMICMYMCMYLCVCMYVCMICMVCMVCMYACIYRVYSSARFDRCNNAVATWVNGRDNSVAGRNGETSWTQVLESSRRTVRIFPSQ